MLPGDLWLVARCSAFCRDARRPNRGALLADESGEGEVCVLAADRCRDTRTQFFAQQVTQNSEHCTAYFLVARVPPLLVVDQILLNIDRSKVLPVGSDLCWKNEKHAETQAGRERRMNVKDLEILCSETATRRVLTSRLNTWYVCFIGQCHRQFSSAYRGAYMKYPEVSSCHSLLGTV